MGTFSTKKCINGSPSLIPAIANRIEEEFRKDGYEVAMDALSSGGYDISLTKGGFFKAILGMKTALKITLIPCGGTIQFEAGVGIFGQQAIPTVISMFVFGPVLITQIGGMVEQAKLDDKALEIAEQVVAANGGGSTYTQTNNDGGRFCTACGTQNVYSAKFCCGCGKQL